MIDVGVERKVEIIQYKNHLELFICVSCIPMCLMGYCAPIFPLFYTQYVRVKYIINHFMKRSWENFD